MTDRVQRFLFDETDIRGELCQLDSAFREAFEHQDFPESLLPIFGHFLAGAALLSEVLKFEGILTLQAQGDGDVSLIMAEANHRGDVRGIVRLDPERKNDATPMETSELMALLGKAVLTITIDPEKGQRYQGMVAIDKPTLAQCLEEYFTQSEQLPTHIQLFADQSRCGGLFLQCLPAQLVTDVEQRQELWNTSVQLANTTTAEELFDLSSEALLTRLFHEMQCRIFPEKALRFHCTCTRERSAGALQSLGYDDAMALLQERDIIGIDCQFCGKTYTFGEKAIEEMFNKTDGTLH